MCFGFANLIDYFLTYFTNRIIFIYHRNEEISFRSDGIKTARYAHTVRYNNNNPFQSRRGEPWSTSDSDRWDIRASPVV